jgi:cyclase
MTTILRCVTVFLATMAILLAQAGAQRNAPQIGAMKVQGNVYLIYGAGANITMQAGDQAVVLVDAGPAELSDQVRAAIQSVTNKRVGYIIQTSADASRTSGTAKLAAGGFFMLESANQSRPQASVVAHINVLDRMSAKDSGVPPTLWPTDTYDGTGWKLYANDEPLIIEHAASAHTDGDSIVFFRRSDVVSTGDIFDMTRYPVIDAARGGSLQGILAALNRILKDITVAKQNEQGGTMIIPGHGHICDRNDLANYRDMLTIIRDRIAELVNKGMTLEQVKAAKPSFDYDGGYGADGGPWTTSMFIETVYRELSKKGK